MGVERMIDIPDKATKAQLRGALLEATLSLSAIGYPEPNPPADATICRHIAKGALVRVANRLTK